VRQFRGEFEKDGGRLDILIANAAVEPGRYIETKDGWESTSVVAPLTDPG
jgi:NAD(P)-dependent dehydrogenase (short-subunit alcohol dehydrogenase family)